MGHSTWGTGFVCDNVLVNYCWLEQHVGQATHCIAEYRAVYNTVTKTSDRTRQAISSRTQYGAKMVRFACRVIRQNYTT